MPTDPFDISIILSALRNFGVPEMTESVRGQQAQTLGRMGSALNPDDLRNMFLGRADNAPLLELMGGNSAGFQNRAASELTSVNRALEQIMQGGVGVQDEVLDLMGERSALENIISSLGEADGPARKGAKGVAKGAGKALGPVAVGLLGGLEAVRFLSDPTEETAQDIMAGLLNPQGSEGVVELPGIGGGEPLRTGDARPLNALTDIIGSFLFDASNRESTGPRQSPTGA